MAAEYQFQYTYPEKKNQFQYAIQATQWQTTAKNGKHVTAMNNFSCWSTCLILLMIKFCTLASN